MTTEDLIYAAAHDLRQPLRTITAYTQMLQRQCAPDPEASELASFIISAANDMNTLLNDLLAYSRIETSPSRKTIHLNSVVQWAIMNLDQMIRSCDARITYANLPELLIDESQFVQLFQRLFSNGLKFRSSEAPAIHVSAEEESETYIISVEDNGQGIELRYHRQIFEPFKRLHGREIPGSGLGLPICQKIVEAHGGKIWVESDGKHGSVFKLSLPV
ncbi:MAG: ATP-binding protein [Bryobacteraceae bacterium]